MVQQLLRVLCQVVERLLTVYPAGAEVVHPPPACSSLLPHLRCCFCTVCHGALKHELGCLSGKLHFHRSSA